MSGCVNSGSLRLSCKEAKPRIGSVVLNSQDELLSGGLSIELRELLEERGVLVFPKLNFSDEQQLAFTRTLGNTPEGSKITKITMDKKENPNADYIKGAFFWHIDGTIQNTPPPGSVMSARRLSDSGGQTEFSNTYAAYDALPQDEKAALEGIKVVHMFETSQRYVNPEPSWAELQDWHKHKPNTLPLVWKHRSGRKSLVLGSTASHVVGMGIQEAAALLTRLRDWATRPEFVFQHQWSIGDMVIWDNTGTMHRAMPYPLDSGRLMHRTQIEGEEPFQ